MVQHSLKYKIYFINIFVCTFLLVCNSNNDAKTNVVNQIPVNKPVQEQKTAFEGSDSLVNSGNIKIVFDKNNEMVELLYNNNGLLEKYKIGRYTNTFGDAPVVEIKQINDSETVIIIITNIVQLGQSSDELTLYSFDIVKKQLNKICDIEDIAVHDMEIDTLSNIIHYSYSIDKEKKKLILEEYSPYKSLDKSLSGKKFVTKTKKIQLTIPK